MKNIVVIGGGTGTFVVLSALKSIPNIAVSAIVTMMDSGGSTGRLRDQLGVLPPGDVRQCMVALSDAPDLWRKLFLYRFEKGDLKGHNFGNIMLTALEKISSNYQEVIDVATYILQCRGKVIPVTYDKVHLCVEYLNGKIITGEGTIDKGKYPNSKIMKAWLKPKARANFNALIAIHDADYIIIGPGDLYTSLIPNLLVEGIQEGLRTSKAHIIHIMNLVTKKGQTDNYTMSDHITDLERYLARSIDSILVNNSKIHKSIAFYYQKYGENIIIDDLLTNKRIKRVDLINYKRYNKSESDSLHRSILRHDVQKISQSLKIIFITHKKIT